MDPSTESTVALTYRRVSTYKQERDGVSLDVQTDQTLEYIRRQNGWRLGGDFSDTLTGRTAKRKDYQALLQETRDLRAQGHRVVVVTAALDRMGRDLEESVRSRKELKGLSVPLHCIREGGVLQELQADIYASIAADESRRIGSRVAGTRKKNRERGFRGPSRSPWGYLRAPATDTERLSGSPEQLLRPNPAEAEYVQEAWQRVADGASVRSVARWAQGLTAEARGGRVLTFANVLCLLKNPTYINRVDDPERGTSTVYATDPTTGEQTATRRRNIPTPDLAALDLPTGRWEPLVSDEVWTQVQQRLAGHRTVPKQAKGSYLLGGMLRCERCGLRMQGRASRAKGADRRSYVCGTPITGCEYTARVKAVDAAIVDEVEALLAPYQGDRELLRAMKAEWARMQKPVDRPAAGRVAHLERIVSKARKRQHEVLQLLADKVINREQYAEFVATEQAEVVAAQKELAELQDEPAPVVLPSFDQVVREVGGWLATIRSVDTAAQRELLSKLVVTVTPKRTGRGAYRAEVTWTELGQALREAMPDAA